jgi:hypothetical protein
MTSRQVCGRGMRIITKIFEKLEDRKACEFGGRVSKSGYRKTKAEQLSYLFLRLLCQKGLSKQIRFGLLVYPLSLWGVVSHAD